MRKKGFDPEAENGIIADKVVLGLKSEGGRMKAKWSAGISILVVILLLLPILVACDNDDNGNGVATGESPTPTGTKGEETITIGAIMDLTGVAAAGMDKILYSLEDLCRYYNDENLIPGVTLKVEVFDDEYDPARDITGFNRLKSQGAEVFFTPVAAAANVLKPFCE